MSAAKRPRVDDGEPLRVPRDVVARIKAGLSGSAPAAVSSGTRSFGFLCWNIDGIDESGDYDRMRRTLAVAEHIASTHPVAVLLQEAIPPQLELLAAPQVLGEHYDFICPEDPRMPYYCVILLHKKRARTLAPPRTVHFATSKMGRHYLAIDIAVDGHVDSPLTFVTTHLESTKSEKTERVKQFTQVLASLSELAKQRPPRTVILAGDLNIRDDEVAAARKQVRDKHPGVDDIVDAWSWCGSPKSHEFTWDTSTNNNLGLTFSSRCRFDRCLFSSPGATNGRGVARAGSRTQQSVDCSIGWEASKFELVGRSKVEGLGRFPSDHWGLQLEWKLSSKAQTSSSSDVAPTSGGPNKHELSAVATPQISDDERARRRELAAKQAMLRQEAASARGVSSIRDTSQNQQQHDSSLQPSRPEPKTAMPTEKSQSRTSAAASVNGRDGVSVGVGDHGVRASFDSASVVGDGAGGGAGDDDESEEAMLARAIQLSLDKGSCSSVPEHSDSTAGSRDLPATSCNGGTTFRNLAANSLAANAPAKVIDLDE